MFKTKGCFPLGKTNDDRGSSHLRSIMAIPKLSICASMVKLNKSNIVRKIFEAVPHLIESIKTKGNVLIIFLPVRGCFTLCHSLPCHCWMVWRYV